MYVIGHQIYDDISIVTRKKPKFTNFQVAPFFLNTVATVLDQKQIHIFVGDFDVDALDHEANQRF